MNKKCLNIFIQGNLYKQLTYNEVILLILHEFAHVKYMHATTKFVIGNSSIFFFSLLSLIFILGYFNTILIIYFVISFVYFMFYILFKNMINVHFEIRADKFAIDHSGNINGMLSLLKKAYDCVFKTDPRNKVETKKFMDKRRYRITGSKL